MILTEKQKLQVEALIKDVEDNWPLRRGKKEFLNFLKTQKNTRAQAMIAQCYMCTGGFDGGTWDCLSVTCPLYFYQPYRESKVSKPVSEEKRLVLVEQLKKARNKKHE